MLGSKISTTSFKTIGAQMKAITFKKFKPVINFPSSANPYYMISVFKTDVSSKVDADSIINSLKRQFPDGKFNFDLEDSDRVFRIEYNKDIIGEVIRLFKVKRFVCEMLI
ncbi:hypothetical protein SAMN05661044_00462 [Olivibacter domesticus]|uniref:Uncharacterized protein n=2 Tax=Olivibacter domesticus TaxID=407022 RepID=A0A1H7HRJ2_OLID1|nr:hypothetical protein SAMN05661044_00462 [Olivibacter domesticus]